MGRLIPDGYIAPSGDEAPCEQSGHDEKQERGGSVAARRILHLARRDRGRVHRLCKPCVGGGPARSSVATALEHDPEKWEPVFGKDHAQTKS